MAAAASFCPLRSISDCRRVGSGDVVRLLGVLVLWETGGDGIGKGGDGRNIVG